MQGVGCAVGVQIALLVVQMEARGRVLVVSVNNMLFVVPPHVGRFFIEIKVIVATEQAVVFAWLDTLNYGRCDEVPSLVVAVIRIDDLLHRGLHAFAVVDELRAFFEDEVFGIGVAERSIDGKFAALGDGHHVISGHFQRCHRNCSLGDAGFVGGICFTCVVVGFHGVLVVAVGKVLNGISGVGHGCVAVELRAAVVDIVSVNAVGEVGFNQVSPAIILLLTFAAITISPTTPIVSMIITI